MSVAKETEDLQVTLDNVIYVLNSVREGSVESESAYDAMLSVAGIPQCKSCRKAMSTSTEGLGPDSTCLKCSK